MNPVINIHNMTVYTKDLENSFYERRKLYSEYHSEVSVRGFDYTKVAYVKEKFPKFPIYLRKQIATFI